MNDHRVNASDPTEDWLTRPYGDPEPSSLADRLAAIPTTEVEVPENPIVPALVTTTVWISAEMRDEIVGALRAARDYVAATNDTGHSRRLTTEQIQAHYNSSAVQDAMARQDEAWVRMERHFGGSDDR